MRYDAFCLHQKAIFYKPVHPCFALQIAICILTVDSQGDALYSGLFPCNRSTISTLKPFRSAHLIYILISICAQSWLSVPPAPGLMVIIALFLSSTAESVVLSSISSSSANRLCRPLFPHLPLAVLRLPLQRAQAGHAGPHTFFNQNYRLNDIINA